MRKLVAFPMEDGGTVIVDAHTAAGANFRVTLRWKRDEGPAVR